MEDYYERLNFILQENINKRRMGGNWWLADTCNEGIVCMGRGLIFVWLEYEIILYRVCISVCGLLKFIFIPLVEDLQASQPKNITISLL